MRKYLTPEDREVLRKLDQHRQGQEAYFSGLSRALQISRREIDVDMLADQVRHFLTPMAAVPILYYSGSTSGTVAFIKGVSSVNFATAGGSWTVRASGVVVPTATGIAGGASGGGSDAGGGASDGAGGGAGAGAATSGTSAPLVPGKVYTFKAGLGGAAVSSAVDGNGGGETSIRNDTDGVYVLRLFGGNPGGAGHPAAGGGFGGTGGALSVGSNGFTGGTGGVGGANAGSGPSAGSNQTNGAGGGGGGCFGYQAPAGAGGNGKSTSGGAADGPGNENGGTGGGWTIAGVTGAGGGGGGGYAGGLVSKAGVQGALLLAA